MLGPGRWLLGPSRNQAICPNLPNNLQHEEKFLYSFENRITTAERGSCWQAMQVLETWMERTQEGRWPSSFPLDEKPLSAPGAGQGHQGVKSTNPPGSGRPVPRNRSGARSGGAKGGCGGLCQNRQLWLSKLVAFLPFLLTPLSTVSV